jgi:eukaryotic-like serine/threonine-protein kinase
MRAPVARAGSLLARERERSGAIGGAAPLEAPGGPESLVLGRYSLCERLGAGGFGVVWRARDELLGREVALKRISLPDGDSERASREALAAARLAHPAIVALYEACAASDAFYLISELVRGETLARLIATRALDDARVLGIGVALVDALAHAHARGVIHRDVKPQNVLVPHESQGPALAPRSSPAVAKLTDFGGALLAGDDVLTRTGDVLGTLAYMAPEQSDGGEVGEAADLYSLALILYEAFSGVNPVRGPTPAATARRIGRPLESLARSRGDLPSSLTRALDRALAPRPGDRGTIDQLRTALADALALAAEAEPARGRLFARARLAAARPGEGRRGSRGGAQREPRPDERGLAATVEPPRALRFVGATERQPPAGMEAGSGPLARAPAWETAPAQPPGARRAVRARPASTRPQGSFAAPALRAWPASPSPEEPPRAVPARARKTSRSQHEPRPAHEPARGEAHAGRATHMAFVRRLWIGCAAAAITWQAWIGRPGVALLMLAALVPVAALSSERSSGTEQEGGAIAGQGLLAGALAPILGLASLAGAFPAIAGQASRWRTRVALGALGYWWLTLSEPLLARRLWLGAPSGTPPRGAWEASLSGAAVHVLGPMLSFGVLLGASLWGVGAVCLPWIVRGRRAALDVVAVTTWSAALAAAAPLLDGGLSSGAAHASPRGAVLGAVFGAVFAVAARALRGPV